MPAGDDEGEEGWLGSTRNESDGQEVSLEVIHPEEWQAGGRGQRLPDLHPHQKGAEQTRPPGHRDEVEVQKPHPGTA